MIAIALTMWAFVVLLAMIVYQRKGGAGVSAAGGFAVKQAKALAIRLPLALLAASFLSQVVPTETIARVLGSDTGLGGIVLASLLGGILPGGPMASFPLALFIWDAGAGTGQMVALLAGWSVFAMHRVLAYEAPVMGWHFVALRMASSFLLPPLAGIIAALIVREFSLSATLGH